MDELLMEYNISYIFYTEGRIFESTNEALVLRSLTESVEVVQEDMKINLRKYINTIITRIQEVWNKFKENSAKKKFKWEEADVNDAIANYDPKITINNYLTYDTEFYEDIRIQKLNYSTMKDHLDSESDFMKTYYGSFYTDSDKSIKDNMRNKAIKSKTDRYEIDKDDISNMYKFIKDYNTDKFTDEINSLNDSAKDANFIANQLSTSSTGTPAGTTPTPQNASYMFYEADEEPVNQIKSSDAPGGDEDRKKAEDAAKEERQLGEKKIENYFKYATSIFSAELTIYREIFLFYSKVCTKFMKDVDKAKANAKREEESNKRANANGGDKENGSSVKQVEA